MLKPSLARCRLAPHLARGVGVGGPPQLPALGSGSAEGAEPPTWRPPATGGSEGRRVCSAAAWSPLEVTPAS